MLGIRLTNLSLCMTIPITVACYTSTKNHTLNHVNSFVLVSPSLSLKFHTPRFSVTIINFEQVFVCWHNGNLSVKYLQTSRSRLSLQNFGKPRKIGMPPYRTTKQKITKLWTKSYLMKKMVPNTMILNNMEYNSYFQITLFSVNTNI